MLLQHRDSGFPQKVNNSGQPQPSAAMLCLSAAPSPSQTTSHLNQTLYQEQLINLAAERKSKSKKTSLRKKRKSKEAKDAEVMDQERLNTGEAERVQRRKGKEPMTEEDLQAEVQASKTSKELQELADLEEAQRLQSYNGCLNTKQIDLDSTSG
ncbi:hypothetical protein Tco_0703483 [Tanacetum coccineum]|uniref:Uncharacterized protein n=1 Tax=Tanacetum coccineum TaxID=301880 RepID=A0ABQ4Y0B5_9ASTR